LNERRTIAAMVRLFLVATALLTATALVPLQVSAVTYLCPDGMMPVPVLLDPDSAKKDRNGNGWVCVKYVDSGVKGGPDDKPTEVVDDIVL
jgi:hypothetical protein